MVEILLLKNYLLESEVCLSIKMALRFHLGEMVEGWFLRSLGMKFVEFKWIQEAICELFTVAENSIGFEMKMHGRWYNT